MATRNIITIGNELLTKECKPVVNFDEHLSQIIDDLKDTLKQNKTGVGLAAPQIGILKRIVVIDDGESSFELVNPEIIKSSKATQYGVEGCLSVPNEWGYVHRPKKIKVKYFDRYGKVHFVSPEDFLCVIFCHEIDHLNGVLFTSIMEEEYIPKTDKSSKHSKKQTKSE